MLIAFLLAAVAPSPVVVAPADVTAQFKGDGTSLKFDPSCRDYTLENMSSDPACAGRVMSGEVAPALAIAARTMTGAPARSAEALALLMRVATASDSPAVHYFLGDVLGSAELVRPDYPTAVKHLSVAAARGNPAAADLLASLILDGKGTPRDVPRAIRLYETAAAGGFAYSGVTLGKLYLMGRYVPVDKARGQAWLDAAATVNAPTAAQLAALARNDAKVSNMQLIPSPDPAKVKVVRFGTFDNPDIPPNFGFDPDFQAVHQAPYDDAATLQKLERGIATLPTPYLYELARRLAARDPERALQTYIIARVRITYDASRCADPAALEAVRAWDMVVAHEMRFIFKPGALTLPVVDKALAAEDKMPAGAAPWWVCRSGMAEMTAAMSGSPGPLKLKPASEWPTIRQDVRTRIRASVPAKTAGAS